jgi:hypothetical protein
MTAPPGIAAEGSGIEVSRAARVRGGGWRNASLAALREAGWAPALVFVAHVVALRGFGAYAVFPPLDIPMHLLGGIAITYFFARSYRVAERGSLLGQPSRGLFYVVVWALATSTTVLWEFGEFLSDRYLGTHAQLGLEDTLFDMFLGCVGSLAFLGATAAFERRATLPAAVKDGPGGTRLPFDGANS